VCVCLSVCRRRAREGEREFVIVGSVRLGVSGGGAAFALCWLLGVGLWSVVWMCDMELPTKPVFILRHMTEED
jgi:hypothetical protein